MRYTCELRPFCEEHDPFATEQHPYARNPVHMHRCAAIADVETTYYVSADRRSSNSDSLIHARPPPSRWSSIRGAWNVARVASLCYTAGSTEPSHAWFVPRSAGRAIAQLKSFGRRWPYDGAAMKLVLCMYSPKAACHARVLHAAVFRRLKNV